MIASIDDKNNLFSITEFYPPSLLEELTAIDLMTVAWDKEQWQTEYERRRLKDCAVLNKFNDFVRDKLAEINQLTGINAVHCDTGFWLDGPGFTMSNHLDNSDVYAAMQIYLLDLQNCPGTRFTDSNGDPRITFNYKQNTGYLMLNAAEQYHEVAGTVPANLYRLCSYTWFYPKL